MDLTVYTCVACYLIGSISFARLVSRIVSPDMSLDDIELPVEGVEETMRMESMSANTVSMKLGGKVGAIIGLLDILKVFIPTFIIRYLFPNQYYFLVAAIAGFIGHCWPIYYGFKGGRGISAFYGGLFAFDPFGAFVISFTSLVIGMFLLKELLFAYAGGVTLVIIWFVFSKKNSAYLIYSLIMNSLFIIAMYPEIKQIREFRSKYGKGDMKMSMTTFPMGRSMLKLMSILGIKKEKNTD
jgi:glycerol-3-phosphate acyltransferase PlsY